MSFGVSRLTSIAASSRVSDLIICIVMFLVKPDGRTLRLVAKQQNGEVILEIRFTRPVLFKFDRKQVIVDLAKTIVLDAQEEARRLSCLIETANLYLFRRRATHFSVQAFTSWVILVAVKYCCKELLSGLYSSLYSSNSAPELNDSPESRLYQATASLAQKFLEGEGIVGPRCDFHGEGIPSARDLGWLYWAIWIGNPHLVNLLMREGIRDMKNPWHCLPLLHIAVL